MQEAVIAKEKFTNFYKDVDSGISKEERAHRAFLVQTFLSAGVPLSKIDKYVCFFGHFSMINSLDWLLF